MTETWLSVREAAGLLGLTERAVQINCRQGKYQVIRKKKKYMIALSSLPERALKKHRRQSETRQVATQLSDLPEWAREAAVERNAILTAWDEFAAARELSPAACVDEFIEERMEGKITRSTLYRWKKQLKSSGIPGLAPSWKNGRKPVADDIFSPEAKNLARDLYEHQGRPGMKNCWFKVRKAGRKNGWRVPSYSTFRRFISMLPKSSLILAREGRKVFEDTVVPVILRDPSGLKPLEVVESDHHQVDVAVRLPDGRVVFPWVTAWMDVRTRKILAWSLVTRPNSDSINISLRELILRYGVPFCVHIDNGKDYRAKMFTGGTERFSVRLNKDETEGIYKNLGIKVSWAIPYNAKSKIIERFFKTFRTEFSLYMRGYRGKDTKERPENLKVQVKNNEIHTLESLKELLYCFFEVQYNEEREHSGKGMNKRTPNQVFYQDGGPVKREVSEAELSLLCSRYPVARKVEQNGIWFNDFQDWYWPGDEIQHKYYGRKVLLRYIEDDPSILYLFDMAGKYLGTAEKKGCAEWLMDSPGYEKHMKYKKAVREATKLDLDTVDRMSDKEREELVVDRQAAANFKEPEMKKKVPMITQFALVIQEEKKKERRKEENRRQIDIAVDIMRKRYASASTTNQNDDDDEATEMLINKYQKINKKNGGNDD